LGTTTKKVVNFFFFGGGEVHIRENPGYAYAQMTRDLVTY